MVSTRTCASSTGRSARWSSRSSPTGPRAVRTLATRPTGSASGAGWTRVPLGWYPPDGVVPVVVERVLAHLPGARLLPRDEHGRPRIAWGDTEPGWPPTPLSVDRHLTRVWRERDQVWDANEVAGNLGISRSTWTTYVARHEAGVPLALEEIRQHRGNWPMRVTVWDPATVTAWHEQRPRQGRPPTAAPTHPRGLARPVARSPPQPLPTSGLGSVRPGCPFRVVPVQDGRHTPAPTWVSTADLIDRHVGQGPALGPTPLPRRDRGPHPSDPEGHQGAERHRAGCAAARQGQRPLTVAHTAVTCAFAERATWCRRGPRRGRGRRCWAPRS